MSSVSRAVVVLLAAAVPVAAGASSKPAAKPAAKPAESAAAVTVESRHLAGLKPRSIGPAIMSGRVSDVAFDPKDPGTFYVALGTGGVMKTADGGATFSPVFDDAPVSSVGSVAVHPVEPKVVWVGTGEGNDRNSSSWGDGVYRSEDAGATWTHVGLETSGNVPRIALHPTDPKVAYAAVMGDLWNASGGRGLYKTADAGKTWKRVLAAASPYDDRVGCGDVVVDPSDGETVYAALYARKRTPWAFLWGASLTDGRDLGGIFKSTDGGATWSKLAGGLPARTGRIGLDVSRKNPRVVMAVVQSDEHGTTDIDRVRARSGGTFRSEDGGSTWTRTSPLDPRPFYFSKVRMDPENDKRVYVLGFMLHVSDDGGKTFREDLFKKVHADCHALAVDPRNPKRLLLGTDGGVYQSWNAGAAWEFLNRFPAGEFYRVNVDLSVPYRICGGLQDNTNWVGPSRVWSKDGITHADWTQIGGGDGFYCVFDPDDPDVVYAESQQGELHRFNRRNGEIKRLAPQAGEGQPEFRFHWNSPLIGSAHEKGVLYLAGNRVFRLTARGERWEAISPDLSATRDPEKVAVAGSGAETYAVVYTLAESPVAAGTLWAGTDDGKLWITRDDGKSWTDLTATLPPEAKGQWISRVEAGHKDAAVAYLAVDAHRSGHYGPLAWRTADGGKTWTSIASGLPAGAPVKVVREDPASPEVLYAGTEFALFVSVDRGGHWAKLDGLPPVAVDDILVHPRDRDLVIATHGRSLYVVDDVRPLEDLTAEVRSKPLQLFAPREAFGRYPLPGWEDSAGSAVYRGENPPAGAIFTAWVGETTPEPLKLEVVNAEDQPVWSATIPAPQAGLHRVSWDLKPSKEKLNDYGGEGALFVPSGEYTVTATRGKASSKQKIVVRIAEGIETR